MSADERKTFLVRCDKSLLERVETWAEEESRSTNAQIIHVLEYVLERRHLRRSMGKKREIKSFWARLKDLFR